MRRRFALIAIVPTLALAACGGEQESDLGTPIRDSDGNVVGIQASPDVEETVQEFNEAIEGSEVSINGQTCQVGEDGAVYCP